jgi:hypothetical protein
MKAVLPPRSRRMRRGGLPLQHPSSGDRDADQRQPDRVEGVERLNARKVMLSVICASVAAASRASCEETREPTANVQDP